MPALPAHETRQALIDEGVAGLGELTPAQLLSAVGVREIAARAGVSVPTLYHHFGTLEDYAAAVVRHLYDPEQTAVVEITESLDRVRSSTLPVEMALDFFDGEFVRLRDDPLLRIRLGLWSLGGSEIDGIYARFLESVDRRIAGVTEAVFESWGRQLRPPFDTTSFVAAEVALLYGSVMRHHLDSELSDAETFSRTALSLVATALRLPGDRRTFDDRLTEINYYPLHHETGARVTDPTDQTRGRILDAAAELFGRSDGSQASVTQIARAAGTSTSTLYRLFDGVGDIAVQLLLHQARDVLARSEDDDLALAGRVRVVADFLAPRHVHALPYAERLLTTGAPVGDPLVAFVAAGALGDAAGEGEGGEPQDRERAELLVLLTVRRLLRWPSAGPEGAVAHLVEVGLLGSTTPEG